MVVNTVYSCELVENVYLIVRVHICIRFIQVRVVKKFYTIKILFILFSFQILLYYTHAGLTTLNINRKFSKQDFCCLILIVLYLFHQVKTSIRELKKGSVNAGLDAFQSHVVMNVTQIQCVTRCVNDYIRIPFVCL